MTTSLAKFTIHILPSLLLLVAMVDVAECLRDGQSTAVEVSGARAHFTLAAGNNSVEHVSWFIRRAILPGDQHCTCGDSLESDRHSVCGREDKHESIEEDRLLARSGEPSFQTTEFDCRTTNSQDLALCAPCCKVWAIDCNEGDKLYDFKRQGACQYGLDELGTCVEENREETNVYNEVEEALEAKLEEGTKLEQQIESYKRFMNRLNGKVELLQFHSVQQLLSSLKNHISQTPPRTGKKCVCSNAVRIDDGVWKCYKKKRFGANEEPCCSECEESVESVLIQESTPIQMLIQRFEVIESSLPDLEKQLILKKTMEQDINIQRDFVKELRKGCEDACRLGTERLCMEMLKESQLREVEYMYKGLAIEAKGLAIEAQGLAIEAMSESEQKQSEREQYQEQKDAWSKAQDEFKEQKDAWSKAQATRKNQRWMSQQTNRRQQRREVIAAKFDGFVKYFRWVSHSAPPKSYDECQAHWSYKICLLGKEEEDCNQAVCDVRS